MGRAVEGTVAWLRREPPERRLKLIKELRKIYSAKFIVAVERGARAEIEQALREACSMPRIIDFRNRGKRYRERLMKLSRFGSRVGDAPGVRETRRWTPPQAVVLEDRYDAMSVLEAMHCSDPPSVTGLQLEQLRMRRGKLESSSPKRKKREKRPNA